MKDKSKGLMWDCDAFNVNEIGADAKVFGTLKSFSVVFDLHKVQKKLFLSEYLKIVTACRIQSTSESQKN